MLEASGRFDHCTHRLLSSGWRVAVIWECALKAGGVAESAQRIAHWVREEQSSRLEIGRAPSDQAVVGALLQRDT